MKNILKTIVGVLGLTTATLAGEQGLKALEGISALLKQKVEGIPYIKGAIPSMLKKENRDTVMDEIFFPNDKHHGLNFESLTHEIFQETFWYPEEKEFDNQLISDILSPYKIVMEDVDYRYVFMANLLYRAGINLYKSKKDSTFLEKAACLGHSGAQYSLFSINYRENKNQEAKNYLFSAAAQKNPDALFQLSNIYELGYRDIVSNLDKSMALAKAFCEEAAKLGHESAIYNLKVATLTDGAYDHPINYQEGIRQLKQLSDQGNKPAQKCLNAIMNSSGDGILEGNDKITYEDLDFLKEFLGWKGEEEWPLSDDEG